MMLFSSQFNTRIFQTSLLSLFCAVNAIYGVEPSRNSALSTMGESPLTFETSRLLPRSINFGGGINYEYTDTDGSLPGVSNIDGTIEKVQLTLNLSQKDFWTINYRPLYTRYSDVSLSDGYTHSFDIDLGEAASFGISGWSVNLKPRFNQSNDILIQTGAQTKETDWGAKLSASRDLSSSLYFDSNYNYSNRDAEQLSSSYSDPTSSSEENSLNIAIRYQSNTRLSSSLGIGYSLADLGNGVQIYNLSSRLNVQLKPTDKTSISSELGLVNLDTNVQGSQKRTNPTYSLDISHKPFAYTTLTLRATKSESSSYITASLIDVEELTTSIQQRLFEHFFLTLSYGQNKSDYFLYTAPNNANRSDSYDSFSAKLSTTFRKRIPVSIFYRHNKNTSTNSEDFGFSSGQAGMNIGYQF